jgi:hypothetical protein
MNRLSQSIKPEKNKLHWTDKRNWQRALNVTKSFRRFGFDSNWGASEFRAIARRHAGRRNDIGWVIFPSGAK